MVSKKWKFHRLPIPLDRDRFVRDMLRPSAESERAPGRGYHRPPGTETS